MANDPLENASVEQIRVRFYVDGYHSWLLAKELAAHHIKHWRKIQDAFRPNDGWFRIFDFEPQPEKLALILSDAIKSSISSIAVSLENLFRYNGHDVIPLTDVNRLRNPLRVGIFEDEKYNYQNDKLYFEFKTDGVVFAPLFDRERILVDLRKWEVEARNTISPNEDILSRISDEIRRINEGKYQDTQKFYKVLAGELGRLSQEGRLRVEKSNTIKLIVEKSVDEDMNSSIWDDFDKDIDLFVIITNDSDHASHLKKLVNRGKRIALMSFTEFPAIALRQAVGDRSILNILKISNPEQVADIWMKIQDQESFQIYRDIQNQYGVWLRDGSVRP
jgi:uncharacterized LabA/DUF88 family protein